MRQLDVQIRFPNGFNGNTQIGIFLFGHLLNFREGRQGRRGVQVIHHGEIFIKVREKDYGKPEARVFHGELSFVKRLLLDPILDIRFHNIAVRGLSLVFQILSRCP